ncbi:MAG TPA: hypothetical protein PKC76_06970 [Saprospiraceae bacterium]|nr:hypothetical protein [Saprospiraceae bacterium]HMP23854.1 hypothetical protein [Saprospiraceae bacterium]
MQIVFAEVNNRNMTLETPIGQSKLYNFAFMVACQQVLCAR